MLYCGILKDVGQTPLVLLERMFPNAGPKVWAKLESLNPGGSVKDRPALAMIIQNCPQGALILHVSLRDLAPEVIVACDNAVDDVDHVLRAGTSLHLAKQKIGRHDFIRCTLAEVLNGSAPGRLDESSVTVFSPFGLGVLDLAIEELALKEAVESGAFRAIDGFMPSEDLLG